MPRETIVRGKTVVGTPIVSDDGTGVGYVFDDYLGGPIKDGQRLFTDPHVEIAWDRDNEYVQIGFEMTRDKWLEIADMLRESPEVTAHGAYTATLTRRECNEAIRTLRRARSAAFGVDE